MMRLLGVLATVCLLGCNPVPRCAVTADCGGAGVCTAGFCADLTDGLGSATDAGADAGPPEDVDDPGGAAADAGQPDAGAADGGLDNGRDAGP